MPTNHCPDSSYTLAFGNVSAGSSYQAGYRLYALTGGGAGYHSLLTHKIPNVALEWLMIVLVLLLGIAALSGMIFVLFKYIAMLEFKGNPHSCGNGACLPRVPSGPTGEVVELEVPKDETAKPLN